MKTPTTTHAFPDTFDSYVTPTEYLETEIAGITYRAFIEHDPDSHIDDDDSHNLDLICQEIEPDVYQSVRNARQEWYQNGWFYCGIVIEARKTGHLISEYAASLWSIEANYPGTDNSYLTEVANELLNEAVPAVEATLERMIIELQE